MKRRDSRLPKALQEPTSRLPATIEPMMLGHLLLSGDTAQYARWRRKVERVRQVEAVDRAADPETKSILSSYAAWRQMRETGTLGALVGLGMGSIWMSWLMKVYAVNNGFGWLVSSLFLLPVPIAWYVGRKMWERAALQGMKDHVGKLTVRKRVRGFFRALGRSFGAGFGLGFTLVFLQALMTWWMTPAPTFGLELLWDFTDGVVIGTMSGFMGMMLGPLVGRPAPEEPAQLPAPGLPTQALPASLDD